MPNQTEQELRAHMALVTRDRIGSFYVNHASRTCDYSRTRQSTRNPPNSPKEIGSGPVMSIKYLELVLILPIKFHPDLSTLSVFQDFRFPLHPLMSPDPTIHEIKIPQFHNFPSLQPPPPQMVES